jgi:hypothetical protein
MFSFLVTSCFTLVAAQLQLSQHTALMDLYDALGSNRQTTRNTCVANKKNDFALRLSSYILPALRGDCTVLWPSSDIDMFWEQRDFFVRKEVCFCVV